MLDFDKFKVKSEKDTKDLGVFSIGPLPRGYGNTVGNIFRRILLSSIDGAAITSVKIKDVKHEYSALPGVMEDVLTILLRLKQLAIKCHSDEEQKITLEGKGETVLKAKDIELTSDVEIANEDMVIAELTDSKARLEMEMTVERGKGYEREDEEKRGQVGVIPIDANFSPVKQVTMDIEKTRIGHQTDLEEIKLEISTNGTISAREALEEAVKIYYKLVKTLYEQVTGDEIIEEEEEESEKGKKKVSKKEEKKGESDQKSDPDLDIDKLNLSARLTNSLIKAGYKNLTELEGKSQEEITEIRGLGKSSAEELMEIMKNYKLEVND